MPIITTIRGKEQLQNLADIEYILLQQLEHQHLQLALQQMLNYLFLQVAVAEEEIHMAVAEELEGLFIQH